MLENVGLKFFNEFELKYKARERVFRIHYAIGKAPKKRLFQTYKKFYYTTSETEHSSDCCELSDCEKVFN